VVRVKGDQLCAKSSVRSAIGARFPSKGSCTYVYFTKYVLWYIECMIASSTSVLC